MRDETLEESADDFNNDDALKKDDSKMLDCDLMPP
jgi:hypothetical protein